MSEMISREDAIEFLCSETVGRGDIYDDAYERAISDMEKLEKIEYELKMWYENAPSRTQKDDIKMLLRMVDLLGIEIE